MKHFVKQICFVKKEVSVMRMHFWSEWAEYFRKKHSGVKMNL